MATSTSHFIKTVTVKDWWLTKADNNSLRNTVAVAGIESAGLQAARVFYSAPIVERLDLFTLKTADGIFVLLNDFINEERTRENGFSEEVFKHFLVGFPKNWEECAEKCLWQGVGSKATVDEAQEATIELQDDQNIDSVEERSFRDTQFNAQNHNKDRHETVGCHDGDACLNTNLHDSLAGDTGFREKGVRCSLRNKREEGVRYSLRNRKVPYSEAKKVKSVAKRKSFSKKTAIGADASTIPSVASLENPQNPGMTPPCDKISKEQVEHPTFAESGGVNDANHAKNIAKNRSVSISGEALAVDKSVHRIKKVQNSCTHNDMAPILQDAGKANNLISHHSFGGKSCVPKKRKQSIAQKNIVTIRPLLEKTGENSDTCFTSIALRNLAKSVAAAVEGKNTDNHNVRDEDESVQTLDHLISANVNSKKRNIREDSTLVGTNGGFSPQAVHKLENSAFKKERKQRGNLTRTNAENKKCHDSARPTTRACTSKAKSKSKSAAAKLERKASQGSTPKLQARRKLYYAEKKTCTTEGENETPTPGSSVMRTSRSGRLLLPTMEFWRNQLPIYDKDHVISGIREGSAILKLQRGGKSSTKKATG